MRERLNTEISFNFTKLICWRINWTKTIPLQFTAMHLQFTSKILSWYFVNISVGGWLDGWMVGWLDGWMAGRLDWLIDWLILRGNFWLWFSWLHSLVPNTTWTAQHRNLLGEEALVEYFRLHAVSIPQVLISLGCLFYGGHLKSWKANLFLFNVYFQH